MTEKKIEILAPAGSYESFHAALCAGADAVYAGGNRFGARAYADNFTQEELIRAIDEAHLHGRKLYLTVNTLLKDREMDELYDYLAPLYSAGLDAVIVQDAGVLSFVRENFPEMDIHASTQMTITGALGAKFIEEQGAKRVVPARELSLGEIRAIREQTGLEIECFVHGALCYCYSGQCLLSSLIGGRSGNRGQCAQPCRLPYTVNGRKRHYLSPKDICTVEIIPELIEAGIDSFKIEGRMKKPEYTAAVTSIYRKYTDLYLENGKEKFRVLPEDKEMLLDLYNRGGSSSGYYMMHNGKEMMALDRPNHAGIPAVKVIRQKGREVQGTTLTALHSGDVIEITGGKNNYTTGQDRVKGDAISFLVAKNIRLKPGTVLNRVRNDSLVRRMHDDYVSHRLQRAVRGNIRIRPMEPAVLTVSCGAASYTAVTAEPVQPAQNRPMDQDRILSQIKKTGNLEFFFENLEIDMEGEIFLPIQMLNQLRRDALEGLSFVLKQSFRRESRMNFSLPYDIAPSAEDQMPPFSVSARTGEQIEQIRIFAEENPGMIARITVDADLFDTSLPGAALPGADFDIHKNIDNIDRIVSQGACFTAALPPVFRECAGRYENLLSQIEKMVPPGAVMIRNYEEYLFLRETGFDKNVILDHNLYVFNRYARDFWKRLGVHDFTAPLELNADELARTGITDCELMVYGTLPVMISAQCIKKTCGQCTGTPDVVTLTDRTGCEYMAEMRCGSCCNVIYNKTPLYLGKYKKEISSLSPKALNLRFLHESGSRTEEILNLVKNTFSSEERAEAPNFDCIQGHFMRGVL